MKVVEVGNRRGGEGYDGARGGGMWAKGDSAAEGSRSVSIKYIRINTCSLSSPTSSLFNANYWGKVTFSSTVTAFDVAEDTPPHRRRMSPPRSAMGLQP